MDDISKIINSISNKDAIDVNKISSDLFCKQIENKRSNNHLLEMQSITKETPTVKESYCHTFYRILGLPVIGINKNKYYNPGFRGNDISEEERDYIKEIDDAGIFIQDSQSSALRKQEIIRETECEINQKLFAAFDNKNYLLDLLLSPIKIKIIDENIKNPFAIDQQTYEDDKRKLYKKVSKKLRPFKCNSIICSNISDTKLMLAAPFVLNKSAVVRDAELDRTFLEYVCRIRFSKDLRNVNSKYNKAAQNLLSINLSDLSDTNININNVISDYSTLEVYVIQQLLSTLFFASKKVRKTITESKDLAEKIYNQLNKLPSDDDVEFRLQQLQFQKQSLDMIYSQLPTIGEKSINCPVNSLFLDLVRPNSDFIDKQIKELNDVKSKRKALLSNINKGVFFTLGEVNGLGLIDVVCLITALWLMPLDHLLGLVDNYSFKRMYRETGLRSELVEKRYNNDLESFIGIEECIKNFDNTVVELLSICQGIIESNLS